MDRDQIIERLELLVQVQISGLGWGDRDEYDEGKQDVIDDIQELLLEAKS